MQFTKDLDDDSTQQTANRVEYRPDHDENDLPRNTETMAAERSVPRSRGIIPLYPSGEAARRDAPTESAGWRSVARANYATAGAVHEYARRLYCGDRDEAEGVSR